MPTRNVCKDYAFDTGPGTQTLIRELPGDYSHYDALTLIGKVTKADTDTGDILDIRLQCTEDGVTWNTRARLAQFLGDMSPTPTAPEVREATVSQWNVADAEEAYEPSGSAGATDVSAGAVRNGPFPGVRRTVNGRQASWRLKIDVTEAGTTACDFEGTIDILGTFAY